MGTAATRDELAAAEKIGSDKWVEILPITKLNPGYEATRKHLFEAKETHRAWTHLRVNMFPDGGIARFKSLGIVERDWKKGDEAREVDLIAVENGQVVLLDLS